ncbi:hypothetical protein V8E36_007258 [Tilletia maclaganii]
MLREIYALRKTQHQNILFFQAVLYDRERVALVLPRAVQDSKTAVLDNRRHGLEVGIVKLYPSIPLNFSRDWLGFTTSSRSSTSTSSPKTCFSLPTTVSESGTSVLPGIWATLDDKERW